jgi:hypothetical protein
MVAGDRDPSKLIAKVPQCGMSKYPGCNTRERRSKLAKVKLYWLSPSSACERRIPFLAPAGREEESGKVSAAHGDR